MQLRILGSSGGWPAAGNPCSGYLISVAGTQVWVDAGSGTLVSLLAHGSLSDVDALWISHLHPDHCADLPMVWHTLAYGEVGRTAPLPVLGPPGWPDAIAGLLDEPSELERHFSVVELADGASFTYGSLTLQAIAMRHSLPTFGLRASAGGKVLSYTADSAPCPAVVEVARDAELFLCEAFLSTEDPPGFTSVMRPEDAGRAATEGKARRLVLTHLHPDADPRYAVARAKSEFSGDIAVASPGTVFEID
jgi:ribonuclease BN (tRNA processing enzyme)